jgi:HPt (histidine-containing phosphotransfer) domain-containing protein
VAKPIDPHQLFGVLLRWIRKDSGEGETAPVKRKRVRSIGVEIPGIDAALGLKRTGGNADRYRALLRKLAATQAGTAGSIRRALATGDGATAERLAHSLKGAAGTLGAAGLAEAAARAEQAIRTGDGVDNAVSALASALDPVIDGISEALPDEAATNRSPAHLPD